MLLFDLPGESCAFSLEEVQELVLLPALIRPPGIPPAVEGFFDLGGHLITVVRLDRLFGLAAQELGLYTPLVVLRGMRQSFAVTVESVREILPLTEETYLQMGEHDSFNRCAIGKMDLDGRVIHILSAERILSREEQQRLEELRNMAQQRLRMLEPIS